MASPDARLYYIICWCIGGLAYFFLITTAIHFLCTPWLDPRLPLQRSSKRYRYLISAHVFRVLNLLIACSDITFEQLADTTTASNTRALGPWVSCRVSGAVRMALFLTFFYTYGITSPLSQPAHISTAHLKPYSVGTRSPS